MNIADTIYQHVKIMPPSQALKVLQFITNIETNNSLLKTSKSKTDILEFIQKLPIDKKRTDIEINQVFQDLRNEWK